MTEWNDERSKSRDKARFGYALQGGARRSQIMTDANESPKSSKQKRLGLIACFYLRTEVAFLHFYAPACPYSLGYLLHRGKEHQHAYGCQHTAVYLTDGRSDETADDEQQAGDEGDVECTHGVMDNE